MHEEEEGDGGGRRKKEEEEEKEEEEKTCSLNFSFYPLLKLTPFFHTAKHCHVYWSFPGSEAYVSRVRVRVPVNGFSLIF